MRPRRFRPTPSARTDRVGPSSTSARRAGSDRPSEASRPGDLDPAERRDRAKRLGHQAWALASPAGDAPIGRDSVDVSTGASASVLQPYDATTPAKYPTENGTETVAWSLWARKYVAKARKAEADEIETGTFTPDEVVAVLVRTPRKVRLALGRQQVALQTLIPPAGDKRRRALELLMPPKEPDPSPSRIVGRTAVIEGAGVNLMATAAPDFELESIAARTPVILDPATPDKPAPDAYVRVDEYGGGEVPKSGFVLFSQLRLLQFDDTVMSEAGPLYPLFGKDGPKSSDVRQGGLGDCWLLASAIAALEMEGPGPIRDMFTDLGDRVVVRLYNRTGGIHPTFTPEWITVSKEIPTKPTSEYRFSVIPSTVYKPIYANPKDGLWTSMLEKAFVVWQGQRNIAPSYGGLDGNKSDVGLRAILGRESRLDNVQLSSLDFRPRVDGQDVNPLLLSAEQLQQHYGIEKSEALTFKTKAKGLPPQDRASRAAARRIVEEVVKKKKTAEAILTDIGLYLEDTPGSANYSERAISLFKRVERALREKKSVVAATETWEPTGDEVGPAGEDISTVPGLAARHAYAVVRARHQEIGGKRFLRFFDLINPWGFHGRKVAPGEDGGLKIDAQEAQTTTVELSEFMSLFSYVSTA